MLVYLQPDVGLLHGLETRRLHPHRVVRNRQQRNQVVSGIVGLCVADDTCSLRRHAHGGTRDHGTRFIRDRAREASVRLSVEK